MLTDQQREMILTVGMSAAAKECCQTLLSVVQPQN